MELWYQETFTHQTTCAAFQLEDPGINLSRLVVPSLWEMQTSAWGSDYFCCESDDQGCFRLSSKSKRDQTARRMWKPRKRPTLPEYLKKINPEKFICHRFTNKEYFFITEIQKVQTQQYQFMGEVSSESFFMTMSSNHRISWVRKDL